jgi:signal peptidase I
MAAGWRTDGRAQGWRTIAGLLAVAVLGATWLYFSSSQVGGEATYSITKGISMEPLLHKNDLALVRAQSSYKVGDVVLYESSVLHRPVLHRIIVIQNGHYFFKGDNNDFVDPGYATRSALIGKLWLHVPAVGRLLGWIGKPSHAALLAIVASLFLILGGAATRTRRRVRRHGSVTVPAGRLPKTKAPRPNRATRYLMPMTRATLTSFAVLLAVGLVAAGVGFATPAHRWTARTGAYSHTGTFTYSARASRPSPTYPSGRAVTGQPLFTSLVNAADAHFDYRFTSHLSHQIHGTIELNALVLSRSSGWQNLYAIEKKAAFHGDSARTGGIIELKQLYVLLNELSRASAVSGAEYSVDLQPVVHIAGTVGGKPIRSTFSPVLPFSVTNAEVKLDVAPPVSPPGATYTPPTDHSALAKALRPSASGTIPRLGANHISIARYRVTVFGVRMFGLLMLALALVIAAFHDRLSRRQGLRSEEEQIAAHFGCLVAPVEGLVLPAGAARTPVCDFTSLVRLAIYLQRPILLRTDESGRTYAVDDDSRVYEYRAEPFTVAPARPTRPRRTTRIRQHLGRPSRITIAGICLALLVAITLVTSLTATTNVPTSNVGASNKPRQIRDLRPAGCSSLSLTSIVIRTGNFTNTASNALVLGDAGPNTITDNGTSNCIVGGGGKDSVNGDTTDICIIGPTAGATYKKCSTA